MFPGIVVGCYTGVPDDGCGWLYKSLIIIINCIIYVCAWQVLLLMRNLSINLSSPGFDEHVRINLLGEYFLNKVLKFIIIL